MSTELDWDATEKPASVVTRQTQTNYGGNDEKVDFYNTTDYEGMKPDKANFKMTEKFITIYSEKDVPSNVLQDVGSLFKQLAVKGFAFRGYGEKDSNFEKFLVHTVGPRVVDIHSAFANLKVDIGVTPVTKGATDEAWRMAKTFYGAIEKLPAPVRLINAAKLTTVLGKHCDTPAKVFVCYSENKVDTVKAITYPAPDFISYMYKICAECNIPIINLAMEGSIKKLTDFIDTI